MSFNIDPLFELVYFVAVQVWALKHIVPYRNVFNVRQHKRKGVERVQLKVARTKLVRKEKNTSPSQTAQCEIPTNPSFNKFGGYSLCRFYCCERHLSVCFFGSLTSALFQIGSISKLGHRCFEQPY